MQQLKNAHRLATCVEDIGTTAGYKNLYSYDKLILTLVQMLIEPDRAFVMGGTWRIPVVTGLQSKNFITDLKKDSTFNETSFEREFESRWAGTIEDAFFDGSKFDRNRVIQKPEYEHSGHSSAGTFYVLSVDVGRKGCDTVICVFKVAPLQAGGAMKHLVNIITMTNTHMEELAIKIKETYFAYKARRVVIDGNGIGLILLDYMVKSLTEPDGGYLPPFGIYNDAEGFYRQYRTNDTQDGAVYIIKANAPLNTEAYSITQANLESGRLKFLVGEKAAKTKLLGTKMGQAMTPEERNSYLLPYSLTTILKDEMLNLREENEGINIILRPANRGIKHDKFSALCYGLYYIKQEEEDKRKRRRFNAREWKFFN